MDDVWGGERTDLRAHLHLELFLELVCVLTARHQRHVAVDAFALNIVGEADDGSFGHALVKHQRRFDLGGADAMARAVHHVVDAACQPIVSVFVAFAAVAGEVVAFVHLKVGRLKALVVTKHLSLIYI